MAEPSFKVVPTTRDWGSPLTFEGAFDTLEEAHAAAREFLSEQRRSGGPSGFSLLIEETQSDGSVVTHPVS